MNFITLIEDKIIKEVKRKVRTWNSGEPTDKHWYGIEFIYNGDMEEEGYSSPLKEWIDLMPDRKNIEQKIGEIVTTERENWHL